MHCIDLFSLMPNCTDFFNPVALRMAKTLWSLAVLSAVGLIVNLLIKSRRRKLLFISNAYQEPL